MQLTVTNSTWLFGVLVVVGLLSGLAMIKCVEMLVRLFRNLWMRPSFVSRSAAVLVWFFAWFSGFAWVVAAASVLHNTERFIFFGLGALVGVAFAIPRFLRRTEQEGWETN